MTCRLCTPSQRPHPENPFRDESPLLVSPNVGVHLASCGSCGHLALHLWQDIYDDTWHVWATLSAAERAHLASDCTDVFSASRAMLRDKTVLLEHPVSGDFSWGPGGAVLGIS
jgi:hypothetical protein